MDKTLLACKYLIKYSSSINTDYKDKRFVDLSPDLRRLIKVFSDCSPYFKHSVDLEHSWLVVNFERNIYEVVKNLIDYCSASSYQNISNRLRIAKRRFNILVSLSDFGGVLKLSEVTHLLSYFSEKLVEIALNKITYKEFKKVSHDYFLNSNHHFPFSEYNAASACGLCAIGLGKLGSRELNYSSDIDLMFFFDEERFKPRFYSKIRSIFISVVRKFVKLFAENTEYGYVYRVDLRLRPDPSSNPICIGLLAAQRYYENFGRNWERAALIKSRAIAGDKVGASSLLKSLRPFIWRQNLDFATIEDIDIVRRKIREYKGTSPTSKILGYNIKTGIGGIREIEFFAQTQQLVCGGRNKLLRSKKTISALKQLIKADLIEKQNGILLISCYKKLRLLEHVLQLIEDKQTHSIPKDFSRIKPIATLLNIENENKFFKHVSTTLILVDSIIGELFRRPVAINSQLSFQNILSTEKRVVVANFFEKCQSYKILRSERSSKLFEGIKPVIIDQLRNCENIESTLFHFDQFLESLSSGVQVLSLFTANPSVLKLLIEICGAAPALAGYLSKNPGVLDFVTEPTFFMKLPKLQYLKKDLLTRLEDIDDFEKILDVTRIWVKENQFKTGVHLLKAFSTVFQVSRSFSDIAEVCLIVLFEKVKMNFEIRYGKIKGLGCLILGMGKLGSREMSLGSDLDIILIYDSVPGSVSSGKNNVSAQLYYARLTQALISAITVATSKGYLYKVDMRLRPSGNKGPVATSLTSFEHYQISEARVWERLALSRGRTIGGCKNLEKKIKYIIRKAQKVSVPRENILAEIIDIKEKLLIKNRGDLSLIEPKYGIGRLQDLELLIQTGALLLNCYSFKSPYKNIKPLLNVGFFNLKEATVCLEAYVYYFTLFQISNITISKNNLDDYHEFIKNLLKDHLDKKFNNEISGILNSYSKQIDKIFISKLNKTSNSNFF